MTISLICACKNRIDTLRISLQSWLLKKEITEIIIVDWSSDESISYFDKLDSRIKIVTVPNKKYFNLAQPLNLAASIATGDYILKVDCDYILNPYYNFFENYLVDDKTFVSGNLNCKNYEYFNGNQYVIDKDNMTVMELVEYVNSYSKFFKHLSGLLFVSRENFEKIGGYNENYRKYYGYEDTEIIHRLKLIDLNEIKLNFDNTIFHIPHSDGIRIKNHEAYDPQKFENENKYNLEYLEVLDHIEKSKKIVEFSENFYIKPLTKWNINKIDNQNYIANEILEKNPLENFPSVYYISLEESTERRKNLENQFLEYQIYPQKILSKRYSESNDIITGKFLDQMSSGSIGCIVSHLKAIKKWYEETDEDYGFFCEDDLSLETIKHWEFTWEEFIEKIPEDAKIVQLVIIKDGCIDFNIHKRIWDDWSVTAYILTRDYAKIIIDQYCLGENQFHLELPEGPKNILIPLPENVLFETISNVTYSIPLFVEDVNLGTTFSHQDDKDVIDNQKKSHYNSHKNVLNYWKYKDNYLFSEYIQNPDDPESNFNIGLWYYKQNHIASASSYFLRCCDRSEDKLLTYESLLFTYLCYKNQGSRDATAKTLLQHCICLLPNRLEAYYFLSKFYNEKNQWQDAYIIASQGLILYENQSTSLKNDIGYPGEYGLLYEKSIAAWWWGKFEEAKALLLEILSNYEISEEMRQTTNQKLDSYSKN